MEVKHFQQDYISLHNQDCLDGIKLLADESVDVIHIDPPYLYLKNQKLERPFDENLFFSHCHRILKKDGFIIMFGRGTSFYRWNTFISEIVEHPKLGTGRLIKVTDNLHFLNGNPVNPKECKSFFEFKEEIVWDKSHGTSPLLPLSRVHETVSIHTKGKGKIIKNKVPYLEMKEHDISSIIQDIKRMKSILNNTKSLDAVINYLENKVMGRNKPVTTKHEVQVESHVKQSDRAVDVVNSFKVGMNEKSIIRHGSERIHKHSATVQPSYLINEDRSTAVVRIMDEGLNEKTIIKQVRDHYTSIHPTQKPVRLIERLLLLVLKPYTGEGERPKVKDFFGGSFSSGEACINLGFDYEGWEIDEEYFNDGAKRIKEALKEKNKVTPQLSMFNELSA